MKKGTRMDVESRQAGEISRRKFLKASAAGVALPWAIVPAAEVLAAAGARTAPSRDTLAAGFSTPPDSAKPWCYWWWLDSNATKEGITADLEEMKRQGIAGALIFDSGKGTNPPHDNFAPRDRSGADFDKEKGIGSPIGPVFMGPEWRELFKHAVQEANRVGIDLSFNIVSGWDCGGAWVTPEHALHRFVWSQTMVQGPGALSRQLPQPSITDGYYREIAVLAFPLAEFTPLAMDKAGVTLTGSSTAGPEFLAMEFPQRFAAASLYLTPNRYCTSKNAELQISDDAIAYRTVSRFDLVAGVAKTVTFGEVSSRFYRVILPGSEGVFSLAQEIWASSNGHLRTALVVRSGGELGGVPVRTIDLRRRRLGEIDQVDQPRRTRVRDRHHEH